MKLCVFIHFSNQFFVPKYVQIYLMELVRHFDEVILVTNEREIHRGLEGLPSKTHLKQVTNEGYDMGMFYKVFQGLDLTNYSQIACINDSNVLFNTLDHLFQWGNQKGLDFWGLIDSYESPWFSTHLNSYHIQSHFLVFNAKAISKLSDYFNSLDLDRIFIEEDKKKLRQMVIDKWEIGLTQFMLKSGVTIGSYFDSKTFQQKNKIKKNINLSHVQYAKLIESGYPLLKKRLIIKKSWLKRLIRPRLNWDYLIERYGNKEWEIKQLIAELKSLEV
jgi:lipopolysaccharide biosynthesis protein